MSNPDESQTDLTSPATPAPTDTPAAAAAPGMSGPRMFFVVSTVVIIICMAASVGMEGRTAFYDLLGYICPYLAAVTGAFAFSVPKKQQWLYFWGAATLLAVGLLFYILSKGGWGVPGVFYAAALGVALCGVAIFDDVQNLWSRKQWHDVGGRVSMVLAMVLFLIFLYNFVPPARPQNSCEIAVASPTKITIAPKTSTATGSAESRGGEVLFEGKVVIRANPCVVAYSP